MKFIIVRNYSKPNKKIMNNNSFLSLVAENIIENEKDNLNNVLILFPNRRAIRFFKEQMKQTGKMYFPCFTAEMLSIDELIKKYTPDYILGEQLQLLYILYQSYQEVYYTHNPIGENETKESFADFYSWGNMILNDFDEIDKSLIDAKILYRNLQDYKDLQADPESYLTKEQIDLINRLFNSNLSEEKNLGIRKNFISIWNCLYEIYTNFNSRLDLEHLSYSGKMYRLFSQRLQKKEIKIEQEKIKIVGFSVLNTCEKEIFKLLKTDYHTDFYFDYDEYYKNNPQSEAGIFIRENLQTFPMNEEFSKNNFDRIVTNKNKINIVSTPNDTTSLAYIEIWLNEVVPLANNLSDIAIVLNDENLIPLVLKSLTEKYNDKINITMGYPFNQTWLYGELIEEVTKLADDDKFNSEAVYQVIKSLSIEIKKQTRKNTSWQYLILKKVNDELQAFIKELDKIEQQDITKDIIKKIVTRTLSNLKIDIISEGIEAIQIMGMLETRALDFEYILMLSTTDDNLPKISRDSSFIPLTFRKAYGMMNIERKTGVFAYYFYRLLHNVKRINYIYTNNTTLNKLKEKSRFIRQLEIELPIAKNNYDCIEQKHISATNTIEQKIRKYAFNIEDLLFIDNKTNKTGKIVRLAPSALNNLIHCEQKFYLNNIKYLREDLSDEQFTAIAFGNIFHSLAKYVYEKFREKQVETEKLDKYIYIAIEEYFQSGETEKEKLVKERERKLAGDDLHLHMIQHYLKTIYVQDANGENEYIGSEMEFNVDMPIAGHIVHFYGRLDRMDYNKKENILRIVDYKTGSKKDATFKDLSLLFQNLKKGENESFIPRKDGAANLFEILFYCFLVYNDKNSQYKGKDIKPELMYLSSLDEKDRTITMGDRNKKIKFIYNEETDKQFKTHLINLMERTIFVPNKQEYKTNVSEEFCKYCDYKILCRTDKKEALYK